MHGDAAAGGERRLDVGDNAGHVGLVAGVDLVRCLVLELGLEFPSVRERVLEQMTDTSSTRGGG